MIKVIKYKGVTIHYDGKMYWDIAQKKKNLPIVAEYVCRYGA